VDRVTLLVIPARDPHPLGERCPAMAGWLSERRRLGDAIAQHGFQHDQPAAALRRRVLRHPSRPVNGEFVGLSDAERRRALDAGWRVLRLAGLDPEGFVAPAYAYTPALRQLLPRRFRWSVPRLRAVRHGTARARSPWDGEPRGKRDHQQSIEQGFAARRIEGPRRVFYVHHTRVRRSDRVNRRAHQTQLPMIRSTTLLAVLTCAAAVLLGAPSQAATTTAPGASTGGVSHVHGTSALLSGRVNPRGLETTYFFEYGPTTVYGLHTATGNAGKGIVAIKVGLTAANLRPGYHYRLVASNKTGTTRGKDRVFVAKTTALHFEVPRRVAPTTYGSPLLISGSLAGLAGAHHQVVLQESPYPFQGAFTNIGEAVFTSPAGRFTFRVPRLLLGTQFRVSTLDSKPVLSKVLTVHVGVRVTFKVRSSGRRGLYRLYGTVSPAEVGAHVLFQLQRKAKNRNSERSEKAEERAEAKPFSYSTRAATVVKRATKSFSRFSAIVTIQRTGRYRSLVVPRKGPLDEGASPQTILLRAAPAHRRARK
jgi:predicted deacetylase